MASSISFSKGNGSRFSTKSVLSIPTCTFFLYGSDHEYFGYKDRLGSIGRLLPSAAGLSQDDNLVNYRPVNVHIEVTGDASA